MAIEFHFGINGTDIAPLIADGGIKWTRNDIDSSNAGRTLAGTMNRGRVCTKIKLEITCRPLSADEYEMLCRLIYPEFVYVQYRDPLFGQRNVQFYSNNVAGSFGRIVPDHDEHDRLKYNVHWEEVSFPLVER